MDKDYIPTCNGEQLPSRERFQGSRNSYRRFKALSLVGLVLLVVALLGCKNEKPNIDSEPGRERPSDSNPELNSPSKPLDEFILGLWEGRLVIDEEAFEKFVKAANLSDEGIALERGAVNQNLFQLSFQEKGIGKSEGVASGSHFFSRIFKWEITDKPGNRAHITLKSEGKPDQEIDILIEDENTFLIREAGEFYVIHFKRQQLLDP